MKYFLLIKTFFLLTLLAAFATVCSAQSWQWGKRGGAPTNANDPHPKEDIIDMVTDQNGNIYTAGIIVGTGGPDIDGHPIIGRGARDIVLSSFRCDGTYRWTKVIGGSENDRPIAMGIDTLGHIYMAVLTGYSQVPGTEVHFDSDTTLALSTNKLISLVQYDTSGNFGWLRQPLPDTAFFTSNPYVYDIHVEGNGDVYWAMLMSPGLVPGAGGWSVPNLGPYILKYNVQGNITDHIRLDMESQGTNFYKIHFNRMRNGDFVFGGVYDDLISTKPPVIGGDTLKTNCFLTKFSSTGQSLWLKSNRTLRYSEGILSPIIFDAEENIYFAGDCHGGDEFNGFTYNNWLGSSTVPFIAKTDKDGIPVWTRNASGYYVHDQNSLSLKNNNQLIMSGTANSMWWDSVHRIQILPNGGYPSYTISFDGAGNILGIDSLKGSFGTEVNAHSQAIDKKGNLYIGGDFGVDFFIGTQRFLNIGGSSDFFIAKYGNNCNCTLPTCTYTGVKSGNNTVRFTYTGSTNIDSLWLFYGDGQKTSLRSGFTTPIIHNYGNVGKVTACLTVWNSCGSNSYCQDYTMPTAIINTAPVALAKVYPNPATNYLTIEGLEGGHAIMTNSLGQVVKDFAVIDYRTITDMRELANGVYFLELKNSNGDKAVVKVVR